MRKNLFFFVILLFTVGLYLNQGEVLAKNQWHTMILSKKYPPHEYTIEFGRRELKVSNEIIDFNRFQGPGAMTITLGGSSVGTVRTMGGITLGGILGPGMLNGTRGWEATDTITRNNAFTLKAGKEIVVGYVNPIFEFCTFEVRDKKDNVVDCGEYEIPIGLSFSQCTLAEWEILEAEHIKAEQLKREKKRHSMSKKQSISPYKNRGALSTLWGIFEEASK